MQVRIMNNGVTYEEHITPYEPVVQVIRSDVEEKTFGKEVLRLLIQDNDSGKIGRFSVSVKIKRGRPVAIVTAFLKEKDVSKRVTGVFKE